MNPVQYTPSDGTLTGGPNAYAFTPIPLLLLYQPRAAQQGSLVFKNGLLINEYGDYAAGQGWFLLTTAL